MRFDLFVTVAIVACESTLAMPSKLLPYTSDITLPDSAYVIDPTAESATDLRLKFEEKDKSVAVNRESTAFMSPENEVTNNNFRFYYHSNLAILYDMECPDNTGPAYELFNCRSERSCTDPRGCADFFESWVTKRDNCNKNLARDCNTRERRWVDSMTAAKALCNLDFSACRLERVDTTWNLIMRKTGDQNSCQRPALIALGDPNAQYLQNYASLHDRANGAHVGWCWFDSRDRYTECPSTTPEVSRSVIRCGWLERYW